MPVFWLRTLAFKKADSAWSGTGQTSQVIRRGVDLPLQGRLALLQVLHPLPVARHDGWPAIRGVAEQRPAASCGAAETEVRGLEVSRPGRGGCRSGSFRHAMQPNWA